MQALAEQQAQMREQMTRAFGDTSITKNLQAPMQLMEEQVRRNTEMFRQAMEMFSPFGAQPPSSGAKKSDLKDIEDLKEQLRTLQSKLDNL